MNYLDLINCEMQLIKYERANYYGYNNSLHLKAFLV